MRKKPFQLNSRAYKRKIKNSLISRLIFLGASVLLVVFIMTKISVKSTSILPKFVISPLSKDSILGLSTSSKTVKSNLSSVISNQIDTNSYNFGIEILNLKSGEEYSLNPHLAFPCASLYKLWIMAAVFEKIDKGQLSLDTKLTQDVKVLNEKFNIDKELAEKNDGTVSETVNDALNQMITLSDNYSALLLTENIGLDNLQQYLVSKGLIDSKVGANGNSPTSTAYDIALFFYKLANGELGSAGRTNDMVSLLKQQALNDKLPKYLPSDVSIAHKTGEIDDYSHDAGIVYGQNDRYIVSIMSKNSDRDAANEAIAKLSKAIYAYFEE